MSFTALHAERLTQGETRWSIPPPVTRCHAKPVAAAHTRPVVSRRRTNGGTDHRARQPYARQAMALASAAGAAVSRAVAGRTRPRHRDVVRFLLEDRGFRARLVETFSRTVGRAMADRAAAHAARSGGRGVGYPAHRVRRGSVRLALARTRPTGVVRRSQGARLTRKIVRARATITTAYCRNQTATFD